jgi:hypothetical protein
VDGIGPEPCPVSEFDVTSFEPSDSTTRELVLKYALNHTVIRIILTGYWLNRLIFLSLAV